MQLVPGLWPHVAITGSSDTYTNGLRQTDLGGWVQPSSVTLASGPSQAAAVRHPAPPCLASPGPGQCPSGQERGCPYVSKAQLRERLCVHSPMGRTQPRSLQCAERSPRTCGHRDRASPARTTQHSPGQWPLCTAWSSGLSRSSTHGSSHCSRRETRSGLGLQNPFQRREKVLFYLY